LGLGHVLHARFPTAIQGLLGERSGETAPILLSRHSASDTTK
jgi:hypothetical protein